jgi:hypothetical protein
MILTELKDHNRKKMQGYVAEIRDHIDRYGSGDCDYLNHRRLMESYYRGVWNGLNEAEKVFGK